MGALFAYMVIEGMISFPTGVPPLWLDDTRQALKQHVVNEDITIDQYETLTGETYTP